MNHDRTKQAIELLIADILERRFGGRTLLLGPHSSPPSGSITIQSLTGEARSILTGLALGIDSEFTNWSVELLPEPGDSSSFCVRAFREAK